MTCRVLRIDEQLYGCEELPAGQPVLCDVLLADAAGTQRVLPYPDEALTAQNIQEGDTVAAAGRHAEKTKVYLTP